MDARFSSAIHALIMIAGAKEAMSSAEIALSVGANASYIRKVVGLLKRQGIIEARQGVKGFRLNMAPSDLTLLEVYQAVSETDEVHVFDLHQNPYDQCVVGRHIKGVLTDVFRGIERTAEHELAQTTLADVMQKMKVEIDKERDQ